MSLLEGLTEEQRERNRQREADTRADYVKGLRALADFYEKHPEVKANPLTLNIWCDSAKEFATARRALGVNEKKSTDSAIYFSRQFSASVTLDVNVFKFDTCKQIKTGRKIKIPAKPAVEATPEREIDEVTWDCGSILEAAEDDVDVDANGRVL